MSQFQGPRALGLYYVMAIIAFMVASFMVQATSYFVINVAHYAKIDFMRSEPIMALGMLTMVIQGTVLAHIFLRFVRSGPVLIQSFHYALLMGLFLGGFLALVQPAHMSVPSIQDWVLVEAGASLVQFSIYGILLGVIYKYTLTSAG